MCWAVVADVLLREIGDARSAQLYLSGLTRVLHAMEKLGEVFPIASKMITSIESQGHGSANGDWDWLERLKHRVESQFNHVKGSRP